MSIDLFKEDDQSDVKSVTIGADRWVYDQNNKRE